MSVTTRLWRIFCGIFTIFCILFLENRLCFEFLCGLRGSELVLVINLFKVKHPNAQILVFCLLCKRLLSVFERLPFAASRSSWRASECWSELPERVKLQSCSAIQCTLRQLNAGDELLSCRIFALLHGRLHLGAGMFPVLLQYLV